MNGGAAAALTVALAANSASNNSGGVELQGDDILICLYIIYHIIATIVGASNHIQCFKGRHVIYYIFIYPLVLPIRFILWMVREF